MNFFNIHRKYYSGFTIWLILLAGVTWGCQEEVSVKIDKSQLLPSPQKVEFREGNAINPAEIETIYLYSEIDEDARFAAELLKGQIQQLFAREADIQVVHSYQDLSLPAVVLGIAAEDSEFAAFSSSLPAPKAENEQSYVLDIAKDLVAISGGGDAGLFYGVQTFIQLMEESKWANQPLSGMIIEDWPELELRWVHYNYFFHLDRFEYLKESIEKLAKYKVNGIVFEFEDRFKYQTQPFVGAPTSLTPEQVKELTYHAHKYHIDIIPLVQGFGHAAYLLKHEELKHLREDPEIYQSFCPLREGTYEFIFDLFQETIDATPGVEYFHVGGDEVRVMGKCSLCREKKEEIGELGLQLTWLNRVQEFMKERGRTLVYWDDMPLKQAGVYKTTYNPADQTFDSVWAEGTKKLGGIIDQFPDDGVYMRWNYRMARDKGNLKILDWYRENNFKAMIATAVIGDYPLIPDYKTMPAYIKSFVTLGAEKEVMGELCTAWGDDSGNHFEIYWLGFLESSEYAWSSKDPATLEQYWEKYIRRFFGPNTEGLIPAFHNLSERVDFWDVGLMEKGNKRRKGYRLKSLPDFQTVPEEGSWSQHFQPLVEKAQQEKLKNAQATEVMENNIPKVTSNAYNLEIFASMGHFMESYCDLVLAIGEMAGYCDMAMAAKEAGNSQEVAENLNKMAATAETAWEGYESTYEELKDLWEISRYPKGEEGYMMNPQTIYLAGRTADLSYLILAEQELGLTAYAEKLRSMAENY